MNDATIYIPLGLMNHSKSKERNLASWKVDLKRREQDIKQGEKALTSAGVLIEEKFAPIFPIIHHDISKEIPIHAQRLQHLAFASWLDLLELYSLRSAVEQKREHRLKFLRKAGWTVAIKDELFRGRELAIQLASLTREELWKEPSRARGLVEAVMSSFTRAIDVLDSETVSETSKNKRKSNAGVGGRFRRRKQASQWRTVISKTESDEYSWRKYGQKEIRSSKFPRSYYRCTHKLDQQCQAARQVQKSEDNPSLFLVTYIGQHSCKNPTIIPNSIEPSLISFGSNISSISPKTNFLSSQRQQNVNEVLSNVNLPDFCEGENSGLLSSTSSLDMSFMVDSFDFQGVFNSYQGDYFVE